MGTKNDPGEHDCYAKAEPDEPMFTLLARDPMAAVLVRQWANMSGATTWQNDDSLEERLAKREEAFACADAMDAWRREHRPSRPPTPRQAP